MTDSAYCVEGSAQSDLLWPVEFSTTDAIISYLKKANYYDRLKYNYNNYQRIINKEQFFLF